jgi:PAS domain S-box-containing protein
MNSIAARPEISSAVETHERMLQRTNRIIERSKQLAVLNQIAASVSQSLDFHDTLNSAVELVPQLMEFEAGLIFLADKPSGELILNAHHGLSPELAGHIQWLKPHEEFIGPVIRTGEPLIGPISAESDSPLSRHLQGEGFWFSVAIPLRARGGTLGVLVLASHGPRLVNQDSGQFLVSIGDVIGVAIENAALYKNVAELLEETRLQTEALAAEKERLAVTLRSIGDGVITTDTEGRIVLLNKVAELLTGWTQEEASGKPLNEVFHLINKKSGERCENALDRVLKAGEVVGSAHHTALVARDGAERLITDNGAPIRDQEGRIIGVVLVFRDVTEKQKMEEEVLKAQKLDSIGVLAGGIAHDFNNILTTILGNISLAKTYVRVGDQILDRLAEAERASLRAKDLTHQLLTFSKGGAPVKKTTSIADIIKESAGFALRGSNVRCEFSIPDDLWPVEADEGQISQVIQNLIINADQAMPHGGIVTVQVKNLTVSADQGLSLKPGKYVKMSIQDQGVGIPEENLSKIFDPYFTTKPGGSGLGLATTYSIIKKHEGYITVESEMSVGTTFTIYLPASEKKAPITPVGRANPSAGRGRILVMDDEVMIRDLTGHILRRAGYEVAFAADGAEALALYVNGRDAGQPFDGVIMDLTIPGGMGGKEAIKRLRDIDPHVKAIVSSGYSNDPVMANFREYGFSGCVAKPYKIEELHQALHKMLCAEKPTESVVRGQW